MNRPLRLLLALAVLPFGAVTPVHSADTANPAYIVTYIEALAAATNQAAGLLNQLGLASRKDAGNMRFEVLQRINQPSHFMILEVWADQAAQSEHATAAHTKEFRAKLQPLLRAPYDERPHIALSVGSMQAGTTDGTRGAIYAVTHVDIIPTAKDRGVESVKVLSEAGRKDKDNIRFEALTQASRPNHMTLVEIWPDQNAVNRHAAAQHTKQFRDGLLPMSGSLYDERLFRTLN